MATISSPGLGSGLDINGIIGKLMQVERQPLTTLARREASFQARLTAFGSLSGALASLQTAARTLATPATFTGNTATAANSALLSAAATGTAAAATYDVAITQLARQHALRSNTPYAATTDTFTTGTLAITVGSGAAVNIAIDGSNNTLAGIRAAINGANAGVNASIIHDGTTNRLVLTSKTSGSAGTIAVAVTDAGSGGTHAISGLASAALVTTQAAQNANLTINGMAISSSSNTIDTAIEGVTLSLRQTGTTTLSVAPNTAAISQAVNAFVTAYNGALGSIRTQTAFDATSQRASVLTGDSTARSIQGRLGTLVGTAVSGSASGIARLSDIGIGVQRDGSLAIDSTRLNAALANSPQDVAALFSQATPGNQGIAVRFDTLLKDILGPAGMIASRTEGINASIKDLQRRAEAFTLRLSSIETRYRAQFTALDTLIASMTQTSNFLTQQLANLPKTSSDR